MRTSFVVMVSGLSLLLWADAAAQRGQKLPGPGGDTMPVSGTVDIGNIPTVSALEAGEWKMEISNTPDVRVTNTPNVVLTPPDFLAKGKRYTITWSTGESETVAVAQVYPSAWIRVEQGARPRWISLATARSIEEAR
jgi:hypothetical protein